ncbi:hypothetical protein B0H63DRAFT_448743 [Podospora didyma]|uniref:Uncharacterized protein n=1 Tax=Podospora didyma TaxID=330526 RepID=A0AAE0NUJ2_9PEZI|nr:hypothetical protein B0H63DRAFT_448743 [Podospora didyma]
MVSSIFASVGLLAAFISATAQAQAVQSTITSPLFFPASVTSGGPSPTVLGSVVSVDVVNLRTTYSVTCNVKDFTEQPSQTKAFESIITNPCSYIGGLMTVDAKRIEYDLTWTSVQNSVVSTRGPNGGNLTTTTLTGSEINTYSSTGSIGCDIATNSRVVCDGRISKTDRVDEVQSVGFTGLGQILNLSEGMVQATVTGAEKIPPPASATQSTKSSTGDAAKMTQGAIFAWAAAAGLMGGAIIM